MPQNLRVVDSVSTAWDKVTGAKGTFWAVIGIMIGIVFVLNIIAGFFGAGIVAGVVHLVAFVVQSVFLFGLLYIGIQRALGEPIEFGMVSYVFDGMLILKLIGLYILQMIILVIPFGGAGVLFAMTSQMKVAQATDPANFSMPIYSLAILCGIVLLIVGIVLALRLYLSKCILVKQKVNPIQAICKSFKATKSNAFNVLGLMIINALILFVSVIPLGLGLIWTIPYLFTNYGEVYKQLVFSNPDLNVINKTPIIK